MMFGWNHFQNNVFQQMNDEVEVNGDQLHHLLCSADERKLSQVWNNIVIFVVKYLFKGNLKWPMI